MMALLAAVAIASVGGAQPPVPGMPGTASVRVLVGGPPSLRGQLVELARLEVGNEVEVVAAGAGAMEADAEVPTLLFAAEELLLRRLLVEGGLVPLGAGEDLAPGFRDPDGRLALTLLSPITLAFDTRVFDEGSAPQTWDELPFATAGEKRVGAVDPVVDPVPMAGWMMLQLEQGYRESRAFGWLTALDARVRAYSESQTALRDEMRSGRVSLAALPLHLVHGAIAEGLPVGHRMPEEGLPARALGVAVRAGGSGHEAARALAAKLVATGFTRRCAVTTGLLAAPRGDGEDLPAAERELLGRLVRPPGPATVDRWLQRFQTDVRGRGAGIEWIDTVLEVVFAVLFAGFLFVVYLRIRRTEPRESTS